MKAALLLCCLPGLIFAPCFSSPEAPSDRPAQTAASAPPTPASVWHNTMVDGVNYLPLEDVRSFYKLLPLPRRDGGEQAARAAVGNAETELIFGPGERELRICGLRWELSHPLKEAPNGDLLISRLDVTSIIEPILRPTYISGRKLIRTVVLDAGHGGHDSGIITPKVREADTTLIIARKLATELRKRGLHVLLTREQNQYLSAQQRVDIANKESDALFLSLHLNTGRSDTSGIETYTLTPTRPGNKCDAASTALATALQASLLRHSKAKDGGCHHAHYSILSSIQCPAALVELGYATHEEESAKLATDDYHSTLSMALADGITAFAARMNPEAILQAIPKAPPPVATPKEVKAAQKKKADAPPTRRKKSSRNSARRKEVRERSSRRRRR
ncbi:MAG: N-acetylmuramoyl-L-alanine amidase [Akkermansia sp.]|nr:N-acetylmuramoyl-L-alanine amidase [Akkermansia sp.]